MPKKEIQESDCKLKVSCTWGVGPDLLITNEGVPYMLYENPSLTEKTIHGYSFSGSFDLTIEQAKQFLIDLKNKIKEAELLMDKIKSS